MIRMEAKMAVTMNANGVKSIAAKSHKKEGVFATILSFLKMFNAATEVSRAVRMKQRPDEQSLRELGINPKSFPHYI